jgi:hypothetical protein
MDGALPMDNEREGTMRRIIAFAIAASIIPLAAPVPARAAGAEAAQATAAPAAQEALVRFDRAVTDDATMHRRLEAGLPALAVTSDPEQILRACGALAVAIRTERSGAARGDIFTPEVEVLLRSLLADAFARRGIPVAAVFDAEAAGTGSEGLPALVVNGVFPWGAANAMWPTALGVLPLLPEELEYRFVGADLVLVDTHANLVVDILTKARQNGRQRKALSSASRAGSCPLIDPVSFLRQAASNFSGPTI